MTQEQYDILLPLEGFINDAWRLDAVWGLSAAKCTTLRQVYNDTHTDKVTSSCPKCMIDVCKDLHHQMEEFRATHSTHNIKMVPEHVPGKKTCKRCKK